MNNNFMEVIEQEANAQAIQPDKLHLDCYMTLAKVMYASQRAEKVKKSKGNIGFHLAGPEDLVDKVQKKLVGEAGSDVVLYGSISIFPEYSSCNLGCGCSSDNQQFPA